MLITALSVLYVLVCLFLIMVVLLQSGKGGGMGSAFGGASQTVFGGAGAGNILTRLTAIGAALFMILSATLAYLSSSSAHALEEADEAKRAREEARSGALDAEGAEEPEPAGMSVPGADGEDPDPAEEAAGEEPAAAEEAPFEEPAAEEPPVGGEAPTAP